MRFSGSFLCLVRDQFLPLHSHHVLREVNRDVKRETKRERGARDGP